MKSNREIAEIFERIANLMELRKGDPFKIRSYRGAAELIAELQTPLADLASAGGAAELRRLPGIGDAISKKIVEILETGTTPLYDELQSEIPLTLLDLLEIDGIGMKTVDTLFRQFNITSLDDFAKFVSGGGLDSVPRLGPKAQSKIRSELEARGYKLK